MGRSRIKNSVMNLTTGFIYRLIITLTAFVVRTVFIWCLNESYLSINGLYSNILSMLSLAELGFGTAMVYSMYKPLADKDYIKLAQLMRLYKKIYAIIGTTILVLGLGLIPFLDYLIKNKPDIPGLTLYYVLFLLNSVMSYWFFAYRNSVLQADQKAYVVSNYSSFFNIIKSILQIILLYVFRSFLVYLVTQIICTVAQNIALAVRVRRDYPIFDHSTSERLPDDEKKHIFKDTKALMLQRISFTVLNSTDALIISAFVGVNYVGLLSNYTMIEEAIVGVLSQVTHAITASLGNYFAKEDRESGYILFRRIEFLNYWLYGFSAIALIVLLNPFVTVWLGKRFLLTQITIIALGCRFFVAGFMNTMSSFRSTLGLFTQGQYRPLVSAIINVALSILLSYPLGVAGVLFATSISRLLVNMWYTPLVVFRYGFHKPIKPFYIRYLLRILLLVVVCTALLLISRLVIGDAGITLWKFVILVGLTAIVPNLVFLLLFYKTDEFNYFRSLLMSVLKRKKAV